MSAAESIRPTFDLSAAIEADLKSLALRSGKAEGEQKYFTFEELAAIEQAAERTLAYERNPTARKFIRYCIALCRSERNLLAAYVNGTITDADAEPF